MVRIEVPEALRRNFGNEQVVPKELEQLVRYALNTQIRAQEVERLRPMEARVRELQARLEESAEREARLDVSANAQTEFRKTPEFQGFQDMYQFLLNAEENGDREAGTARKYWDQTVQPAYEQFVDARFAERTEQMRIEIAERAQEAWKGEAWQRAQQIPQPFREIPEFATWWVQEYTLFTEAVRQGYYEHLGNDSEKYHAAFSQRFVSRLRSEPASAAIIQRAQLSKQQRETQDAAAAAAAAATTTAEQNAAASNKLEAEAAVRRARENPFGNVAPGQVVRNADGAAPKINAKAFDRLMKARR